MEKTLANQRVSKGAAAEAKLLITHSFLALDKLSESR